MELEEAIKQLKDLIKDRESFLVGFDDEYDNVFKKDIQAIETALKELDVLKFKYQARKDRTDTIIKKQEKMIEYMVNWINDHEDPFEGCHENGKCENELIPCKECIKQYFEKKAEETN